MRKPPIIAALSAITQTAAAQTAGKTMRNLALKLPEYLGQPVGFRKPVSS